MSVLLVCDHDRGVWADANDEGLTAGRSLAEQLSCDLHVALMGEAGEALAAEAASGGAAAVHIATHPHLSDYGSDAWADALAAVVADQSPVAVLAVGTDRGNEVLAQLAARLDTAFVANCTVVEPGDDLWKVTRSQWGGSLLEDTSIAGGAGPYLLSFGHHAVEAQPAAAPGAGTVQIHAVELDDSVLVTQVKDREGASAGVTLSTAPVVVSGGRGVGSAEGFGILEELAGLMGGVVGCSRAVTNLGWRNHTDQVGQTGTRIAPEIYIATGISGAIQHWVGAMASKRILAVNTDPEANMVAKADYAVIADLHEVVPAITAEIQRRRG